VHEWITDEKSDLHQTCIHLQLNGALQSSARDIVRRTIIVGLFGMAMPFLNVQNKVNATEMMGRRSSIASSTTHVDEIETELTNILPIVSHKQTGSNSRSVERTGPRMWISHRPIAHCHAIGV
jgi:hypothetical protein